MSTMTAIMAAMAHFTSGKLTRVWMTPINSKGPAHARAKVSWDMRQPVVADGAEGKLIPVAVPVTNGTVLIARGQAAASRLS
jgi:hypothetical protein